MAAPVATPRGTPTGKQLRDGYRVLITFANASTICLFEKTTQPPAIDGGAKIDQTTQWNDDFLTAWPQQLSEMTDAQMTCGYDPNAYTEILAIINTNTTITYTFADGSTLAIWGYLAAFTPASQQRGTMPEATVKIVHTNLDNSYEEYGPVLVSVAGT